MAAVRAVLGSRGGPALRPPPGQSRGAAGGLLQLLGRWLNNMEVAVAWGERLQRQRLQRRNAFEGQEHWMQPEGRWHPEVLRLRDVPVVAVDLSGSPLTYSGLDNLVPLTQLQHLDLSGCPHLDDWALGRLHVFGDSLQELSVSRCPRITERGLATLHHLQLLRRLDVAGVHVPSPGLVHILLEEMLPGCQVLGLDLGDSVKMGTPMPPGRGQSPP
ncbi:distal membrane-arm assembly complex protein 2 isoform X2 [Falco rusticolus]|uniref:distal membrane-arm assembly complex protein 2 isoform X2 n=1 Tax=Falco rusticolus TaxID=120794 RepID=UPI0018868389|nr:distal membrane-arm assembly complex protein 2 isoform X2 [Falco rusticolus]XP_055649298.1 distal membrane-arm assembly complex protein 2 isoform X2 [Falco peregrinus]